MLSQTCEYALRAVACLAQRPGEFVTASDLADATSVPSDYLSKVLQQLAGAKVVQGRRGVGGGYRLARDPEDISLYEIIDAMGVIQRLRSCPTHGDESKALCPLHATVDAAIHAAENVFRAKTLASVLDDENSSGPLCVTRQGAAPATNGHRAPAPASPAHNGVVADRQPAPRPRPPVESPRRYSSVMDARPQFTANGNLKAKPRRVGID